MKPGLKTARAPIITALAFGFAMTSGCRLDGSWKVVERAPAPSDDARVIDTVTFTSDGRYTMTESRGVDRITTTGRYAWSCGLLALNDDHNGSRSLKCRRDWAAGLMIKSTAPGASWSATLHRDE